MNRRRVFSRTLLALFFITSIGFLAAQGETEEPYYGRGGYGHMRGGDHMGGWGQSGPDSSDLNRGFGPRGGVE